MTPSPMQRFDAARDHLAVLRAELASRDADAETAELDVALKEAVAELSAAKALIDANAAAGMKTAWSVEAEMHMLDLADAEYERMRGTSAAAPGVPDAATLEPARQGRLRWLFWRR